MAMIEKKFDAVQVMRSIRDRISDEIDGMTFEEEQSYIKKRLRDASNTPVIGSGDKGFPAPGRLARPTRDN
ncbi:MAG: hypothetical protein OXT71_10590 [Acidobacteriota bacterium]|nr:hypothetical protein [Acidobacteriota bacterium]